MAEPGADTSGGMAAPPQPPPQTETTGTDMTERCGAPPTEAQTAGRPPQPHQPPLQTEAPGAGVQPPRAPSHEAPAEAENLPTAPPPSQEQDAIAKEGEDSAMTEPPRPSCWSRVRPPVLWLLSLFRLRKQNQLVEQSKIPAPPPEEGGAGGVPDKPATEKDDGERRREELPPMKPRQTKRRKSQQPTESIPPPQPLDVVAGLALDARFSRMKKKLQNAGSLVMNTMSWYRRHRSPEKVEETKPSKSPAPQEEAERVTKSKQDKVEEATKQPSTPTPEEDKSGEKKPHPRWGMEEARLEKILEEACKRLVATEFWALGDEKKRQCLLTFSVFPLGEKVKKQAVTYWWATQFGLSPAKRERDGADDVFTKLSDGGFLEPIKNRCSGVIHGCRVNPLVHWMVKHLAREMDFADLESRGDPAYEQFKSAVLCLTASNHVQLQSLRKPSGTKKTSKETPEVRGPSQDLRRKSNLEDEMSLQTVIALLKKFEEKQAILNISAHVYRLPELLLSELADGLEVLQLGRWWNSDDQTYMEVEALECIGKLKNLRYLSLRGLSRLTALPSELRKLRRLAILDVRGCQNLVRVSSWTVENLKGLTHLDLTECYMLEHIGRGITALSGLQVFKGFVFGVGAQRRKACRLSHLAKLRNLRKLSVNVTTDTTLSKDEMPQLRNLTGLLSLTVTWGELPSILLDDKDEGKRLQLQGLLEGWTGLVLPPNLEKLDVRCYPKEKLPAKWFEEHKKLKKLYVRGGEVKELAIPTENINELETLRLRYLNKFRMKWDKLFAMLNRDKIKSVEVVDIDQKVMMNQTKGKSEKVKDEQMKKKGKDEEEHIPIKKRMDVPESTLDEKGVWVRDEKEEYGGARVPGMALAPNKDDPKTEAATGAADVPKVSDKAREGDGDGDKEQTEDKEGRGGSLGGAEAEDEPPNKEDGADTSEVKKVDGGDKKGREMVKEEGDNKKEKEDEERNPINRRMGVQEAKLDESGARARDEKKLKEDEKKRASSAAAVVDQSAASVSGGDVKEGAGADEGGTKKCSVPEPLKASQAPHMAPPKDDAPKTEAATGAADIPKVFDKGKQGDDDGKNGGAGAEDELATEEDRGDVNEVRKVDGGDADKAQTEGEDGDKDEQPTIGEDRGDDDTSVADATSSPAVQLPELKEQTSGKLIPAAKASASHTTTPPAPPATMGPAPVITGEAAVEPKEPAKAGDDDGLTGTGAADTRSSTSSA